MSTVHNYPAHFRECRNLLGLTQQEMADALLLSRNYIAQIETGKREPSVRVLSALETLVDRKRTGSTPAEKPFHIGESPAGYHAKGATAEALRQRIRHNLEDLLTAAGDDMQRLGWIMEQQFAHMDVPGHWNIHEQVIKQVLEEQRQQKEARQIQSGRKSQGGAA